MTILVVMAMSAEAEPLIDALGLEAMAPSPAPRLPAKWYSGSDLTLIVNGVDPVHRVDSIGSTAAALTTLAAMEQLHPDWVISAGTAGGFIGRGGYVGQVVVARGPVIHHDRRIPLGRFDEYGRGSYPSADLDELAQALGFTVGPVSTGDSLDAPDTDLEAMAAHGTIAKDMEAAAVARVAALFGVRFTACKVITDLVDGPEPTADEFVANMETASATLAGALPRLVAELHSYRQDRPS